MEGSRRLLSTLDLPPATIGALANSGYIRVQDVVDASVVELSLALQVSPEEANSILLKVVINLEDGERGAAQSCLCPVSAAELAQMRSSPIITFCKAIDTMLGGGAKRGQLTEMYGAPGTGKTQIGMQLAVDVQIPKSFGGSEGTAVYLDTEGSFLAERVAQIADAFLLHLQKIARAGEDVERKQAVARLSRQVILSNIHVFRILDDDLMLRTIAYLPSFLETHPEVKLVVIDSLAFHLRQDTDFQTETNINRAFLLGNIGRELNKLAYQRQVAVLVTNQMTTKVEGDRSKLVPTLGEAWAPFCATRLELGVGSTGKRYATLVKSASVKRQTVNFEINHLGVRDVSSSRKSSS